MTLLVSGRIVGARSFGCPPTLRGTRCADGPSVQARWTDGPLVRPGRAHMAPATGIGSSLEDGRRGPQPPTTRRVGWIPASEWDGGGVRAAHGGADAGQQPAEPAADGPGGAGRDGAGGADRAGRWGSCSSGDVLCWAGRRVRAAPPDGRPSVAQQEPATAPVVDRELVGREQAHAERVARRRAPGSHVTSAPSGPAHRKRGTPDTNETALRMISRGPFLLVAGVGFEPTTSGL